MKRQRESSPSGSKRPRERREDPPLALLMAESRGYHRRSRSREKTRTLRGACGGSGPPAAPGGRPQSVGTPPRSEPQLQNPRPPRPGTLEYKTLLISNLGAQVSDEDVEDALFHEFKKFGDVSVKLSVSAELGRVAYVNFRHPEDAKEARHSKNSRLVLGERQLKIEPITASAPCLLPAAAACETCGRDTSPWRRSAESETDSSTITGCWTTGGGPTVSPPTPVVVEDLKPEDDQRATSNLFIGNLDGNVTEAELRRGFDKYGVIEDVVIKRPARGQGGAYAFVKFQNLDMAHRAKVAMQGRLMGGNPIKIGYGKANPTTRLWVGGLPSGNSLAALAREFDRFGSIRNIDYVKGDSFAYIQYESLDASQAACTQMRGFPLGGGGATPQGGLREGRDPPHPLITGRDPPHPPNHRERPSSPPNHRERPSSPPREKDFSLERSLERGEMRVGAGGRERPSSPPPQREKDFSLERREAFGRRGGMRSRSRSRERWLKEREERRGERGGGEEEKQHLPPRERGKSERQGGGKREGGGCLPRCEEFAAATLTKTWHGFFALKNSSFPAELFLLEGGAAFFHASLKRAAAPPGQLKIAQRLRMDRTRLDEVRRRLKTGRPDGFSVLLALQGPVEVNEDSGLQARLLRHLVTYLRNKEAAGVVSLPASGGGPGAMLYAFPPGLFSQQYLQEAKRTVGNLDEEHMVVVIVSDTN
ncbi:hypothetical protein CesoFtcFv8_003026 [Champsocephalus esox]|uniref:RNA-binding protein 15B n=1 Tax=Champsocephalus esox TaxID=159716 RepID=A0AAN8CYY5_9TELE|nr:hypothetical protein CesoFtcFv8_003026 [Champsocephalus esox]